MPSIVAPVGIEKPKSLANKYLLVPKFPSTLYPKPKSEALICAGVGVSPQRSVELPIVWSALVTVVSVDLSSPTGTPPTKSRTLFSAATETV